MPNGPGNYNYIKRKVFECSFNLNGVSVKVEAHDTLSAERALVDKAIEDIRWQLIKQVCANEVF